jgi:hypothetical protein
MVVFLPMIDIRASPRPPCLAPGAAHWVRKRAASLPHRLYRCTNFQKSQFMENWRGPTATIKPV